MTRPKRPRAETTRIPFSRYWVKNLPSSIEFLQSPRQINSPAHAKNKIDMKVFKAVCAAVDVNKTCAISGI